MTTRGNQHFDAQLRARPHHRSPTPPHSHTADGHAQGFGRDRRSVAHTLWCHLQCLRCPRRFRRTAGWQEGPVGRGSTRPLQRTGESGGYAWAEGG